jgi:hypothetical protein
LVAGSEAAGEIGDIAVLASLHLLAASGVLERIHAEAMQSSIEGLS